MTVTLQLSPDAERRLSELAAQHGATLKAYAEQVLEREARSAAAVSQGGTLAADEFERCLDELAEGLPSLSSLPADFSRADIYGEHP